MKHPRPFAATGVGRAAAVKRTVPKSISIEIFLKFFNISICYNLAHGEVSKLAEGAGPFDSAQNHQDRFAEAKAQEKGRSPKSSKSFTNKDFSENSNFTGYHRKYSQITTKRYKNGIKKHPYLFNFLLKKRLDKIKIV